MSIDCLDTLTVARVRGLRWVGLSGEIFRKIPKGFLNESKQQKHLRIDAVRAPVVVSIQTRQLTQAMAVSSSRTYPMRYSEWMVWVTMHGSHKLHNIAIMQDQKDDLA